MKKIKDGGQTLVDVIGFAISAPHVFPAKTGRYNIIKIYNLR
jgi:hypothetical protein